MGGSIKKVPGTKILRDTDTHPVVPTDNHGLSGIKLFCGSASKELGKEIASYLELKPGEYRRIVFPNENIFIQLQESVRG